MAECERMESVLDGFQTFCVYSYLFHEILVSEVHAEKGICSFPLGLSDGSIPNEAVTTDSSSATTPEGGRLGQSGSAWCFSNESISNRDAVLRVDLGQLKFVSGVASQGPPEDLWPLSYNHLVAFGLSCSTDAVSWKDMNEGNLFFDVDKNDTAGTVTYHTASTIELARYLKISVSIQVSGSSTICLRLEIYGCDTDVKPFTSIKAVTTTKGRIQVSWEKPSAINTRENEDVGLAAFSFDSYDVYYWPAEGTKLQISSADTSVLLDDVRLGATYTVEVKCRAGNTIVDCDQTDVEAYPPCPTDWTSGNEYHCFLLLLQNEFSSFSEARDTCLTEAADILGPLGAVVDENEQIFITRRILDEDVNKIWIVGELCLKNESCCISATVKEDGTLFEDSCSEEEIRYALCIRDHKGEGSRLRVTNVYSLSSGTDVKVSWRYEGDGWKTDELQVKLWTEEDYKAGFLPDILTFSTLKDEFVISGLKISTQYRFSLRPAPNIRTEEQEKLFIILEFPEGEGLNYGVLLTPLRVDGQILWKGELRVSWEAAYVYSEENEGSPKAAERYVINVQGMGAQGKQNVEIPEGILEYRMTPVAMGAEYIFRIGCYFVDVEHICGEMSMRTDHADLVVNSDGSYVIYDFVRRDPKNWTEAEADCDSRMGHLVSVLSEAEGKHILGLFPSRDTVLWTGAKLGQRASGYWTDGTKITDLLMAKTSGVTISGESCCRALNEGGKLRLSGGNCEDKLPYICKYTVGKLMEDPQSVDCAVDSPDSIRVTWGEWTKHWLPSYVEVSACPSEDALDRDDFLSCVSVNATAEDTTVSIEGLEEFMCYEISVEAVLLPVSKRRTTRAKTMTHPKRPIHYAISTDGKLEAKIAILIAEGKGDTTVEGRFVPLEGPPDGALEIKGTANTLTGEKLVPGLRYRFELRTQDESWSSDIDIDSAATCEIDDVRVEKLCYTVHRKRTLYENYQEVCEGKKAKIWSPEMFFQLKFVAALLPERRRYWLDLSQAVNVPDPTSSCASLTDVCCWFFDTTADEVSCSCCDDMNFPVCVYQVKADLGKVNDLTAISENENTIDVVWVPPTTSWSVQEYEVQWRKIGDNEESATSVRTSDGTTSFTLHGLEPATDYVVSVKPYASGDIISEFQSVEQSTTDPNEPLSVQISDNGFVSVRSPRLEAKGRGDEEVTVKVFESKSDSNIVMEVKGPASNVTFAGLKVFKDYEFVITSSGDGKKKLEHSDVVHSSPTCLNGHTEADSRCVGAWDKDRSAWREAEDVCKGMGGWIYGPQEYDTEEGSCSYLRGIFEGSAWIRLSSAEGKRQGKCESSSNSPVTNGDGIAPCCYCDEQSNELYCGCCQDTKYFLCQYEKKVDFGQVGEVTIHDVTEDSVSLSWKVEKPSGWYGSSFVVMWADSRSPAQMDKMAANRILADEPAVVIKGLEPGVQYRIVVSPSYEGNPEGVASEIRVTTRGPDIMWAGFQEDVCSLIIFKIVSCCAVILGSAFTLFIFAALKMYHIDNVAHMCSEIALMAAYMCVLIGSVQSYSTDDTCLRPDPTLCTATAVLIQFFFQSVFLFMLLEALLMIHALRGFCLPSFLAKASSGPGYMIFVGWGIPSIILIVSATVASNEFTDGNDNCWLDVYGRALYPSVIPIGCFAFLQLLVLIPTLVSGESMAEAIPMDKRQRVRVFFKMRWASLVLLLLVTASWLSGMFSSATRLSWVSQVFVASSVLLALLLPILRISCDDEAKQRLKKGLWKSFRENSGLSRVRPSSRAFSRTDTPYFASEMRKFDKENSKKNEFEQKSDMARLVVSSMNKEINKEVVWHK